MGGSLLIILLSVTGGICLSTCICIYYSQCNRIDNSISDNTVETVTITKEHYENLKKYVNQSPNCNSPPEYSETHDTPPSYIFH